MNSFQPTTDETYDIPATAGSSLVSQLACASGSIFPSTMKGCCLAGGGVAEPTMARRERLIFREERDLTASSVPPNGQVPQCGSRCWVTVIQTARSQALRMPMNSKSREAAATP